MPPTEQTGHSLARGTHPCVLIQGGKEQILKERTHSKVNGNKKTFSRVKSRCVGLAWCFCDTLFSKESKRESQYFRTKLVDERCCKKARRGIQKLVLHMVSLSVFGSTGQEAGVVASSTCEGHADGPQFVKLAVSGSNNQGG